MKRKIFEGKCPWDDKKITISLNEEAWQDLCQKFGMIDKPEVVVKRWWQGDDCLEYFLFRFLKIKTKERFTFAEYYHKKHRIVLYPEITIFLIDIAAERDLKKIIREAKSLKFLFALHLAHEFGHALDRFKMREIYSKIKKINPWVERRIFFMKAKGIFEERARRFENEYGVLFVDAIEVEIA